MKATDEEKKRKIKKNKGGEETKKPNATKEKVKVCM